MKKKNIRLQDIADSIGCSLNTVSLILRGSTKYSEALTNKVKKTAKELGYIRNIAASNLASKRSGIIGIYARNLKDAVRYEMVNQLIVELSKTQYKPMLAVSYDFQKKWHESTWIQSFLEFNVDAVIAINEQVSILPEWAKSKPLILSGSHPGNARGCDEIALDRKEALELGVNYLISKSHKKIGVVDFKGGGCFWYNLSKGISVRNENIKFSKVLLPSDISENNKDTIYDIILKAYKDGYYAFLVGDTPKAISIASHIQNRNDKIFNDIEIVAYDYFPWNKYLKAKVITIEQPIQELVNQTVDVLRKRLNDPSAKPIRKILKHTLAT